MDKMTYDELQEFIVKTFGDIPFTYMRGNNETVVENVIINDYRDRNYDFQNNILRLISDSGESIEVDLYSGKTGLVSWSGQKTHRVNGSIVLLVCVDSDYEELCFYLLNTEKEGLSTKESELF